jgi:hypothetical protein
VYSREVGNEVLEFGVSGKLIMNVMVMYDRRTNSLWSQLLGRAVRGPLEGTELEYLPAWQTTWSDWKSRHPQTRALVKGYSGDYDPYTSYYSSGSAGVIGETRTDDRLQTKQFVIGVDTGQATMAFPFSELSQEPVVNAQVGELPVLVLFDADNANGVAYSRLSGDRVLTFESAAGDRLRDLETGTLWNSFEGQAIEGPLAGEKLDRVKSTTIFWFGWKDFHPDTEIYEAGA